MNDTANPPMCAGPHLDTRKPKLKLPPKSADCHCHVFGPGAVDWEVVVFPDYQPFLLAILPPGAFIFTGLLIVLKNLIDDRMKKAQEAARGQPVKGAKRARVTGTIS